MKNKKLADAVDLAYKELKSAKTASDICAGVALRVFLSFCCNDDTRALRPPNKWFPLETNLIGSDGDIEAAHMEWVKKGGKGSHPLVSKMLHYLETRPFPASMREDPIFPTSLLKPGTCFLPVALYSAGAKVKGGGQKGAPLALRLYMEVVQSADKRWGGISQRIFFPTRRLIDALFPNRYTPPKVIQEIVQAVEALKPAGAPAPITGKRRQVIALAKVPIDLDDDIVFDVFLPINSMRGPQMKRQVFRQLGVNKALAYIGYMNLTFFFNQPNKTIKPPKKRGRPWTPSDKPGDYGEDPLFTDDINLKPHKRAKRGIVQLFYPGDNSTGKKFSRRLGNALDALRFLIKEGLVVIYKRRIMPSERE